MPQREPLDSHSGQNHLLKLWLFQALTPHCSIPLQQSWTVPQQSALLPIVEHQSSLPFVLQRYSSLMNKPFPVTYCFCKLSEAVSVAGPRIMLREVMSAVPLRVAPLTFPWNVRSMDAIWNLF